MSHSIYNKPPLPFKDQLTLLASRNLIIEDEVKAQAYLSEINYYRLSAYFLPYQNQKDRFNEGITFQQIIDTYSFDRELRLLVFDCIERIEIAIRTQIIYSMAIKYNDSHWQDNPAHFVTRKRMPQGWFFQPYEDFQNIIKKAKDKPKKKQEVFLKHYLESYTSPSNPPSWMCFELLTMGELSNLFKGLSRNEDKKEIANFFDVHHKVFESWLHSLTYVRNLCAHHSRVWNRDLAIEPEILKKPIGPWMDQVFLNNKRVFYFLSVLKYLLDRANPGHSLKSKLILLFEKYSHIPIQFIGIPSENGVMRNWEEQELWK